MIPAVVAAKGITYDCDTAANHFSELILPVEGTAFTVSGKIQLNTLAPSKTYAPLARVQIASSAPPGQLPEIYAVFALTALPADPKKTPSGASAVQMLTYNVSSKEDEVIPLSLMTKPGTVQPFSLSYDGTKLTIDIGSGGENRFTENNRSGCSGGLLDRRIPVDGFEDYVLAVATTFGSFRCPTGRRLATVAVAL